MEFVKEVLEDVVAATNQINNLGEDEYRDEEGFICCKKCRGRREEEYDFGKGFVKVRQLCRCQVVELKIQEQDEKMRRFKECCEINRKEGITDPSYLNHKFSQDDGRNKSITGVCERYVEHFDEMKENNIGIMFYGGVGTGKSFLACCIANALIDKGIRVGVTNFSRILNRLQVFDEDKQNFIDRLCLYDLLIIDDLGIERNTPYALEQVYNVIDARCRSGKPIIVTTNLSLNDIKNPVFIEYERIYDRIFEMCPIKMKIEGESRRKQNASDRRELAKKIMGLSEK